jgi:hypothetical protein
MIRHDTLRPRGQWSTAGDLRADPPTDATVRQSPPRSLNNLGKHRLTLSDRLCVERDKIMFDCAVANPTETPSSWRHFLDRGRAARCPRRDHQRGHRASLHELVTGSHIRISNRTTNLSLDPGGDRARVRHPFAASRSDDRTLSRGRVHIASIEVGLPMRTVSRNGPCPGTDRLPARGNVKEWPCRSSCPGREWRAVWVSLADVPVRSLTGTPRAAVDAVVR